ncbi:MAG: hypothetical protein DRN91_00325 [Candidatus Alkanophagales archaeon]|nr:MAG: hypothetical protein DRN91_00325 [Candidatus Alkanophagales archaeon]
MRSSFCNLLLAVLVLQLLLIQGTQQSYAEGQVNSESLERHIKYLSSLQSRVPGYKGYYEAQRYIVEYFKRVLGEENVELHTFKIVVPIDYGARITLTADGENLGTLNLYSLWPNLVATCTTRSLTGRLIYWEGEMDGLVDLNGSIVLMGFNTGSLWLKAAEFGAKAVIFTAPSTTNRMEAKLKFLSRVPFHFPRFYAVNETASRLMDIIARYRDVSAEISSNMTWRSVAAYNIIGFLRGSEYQDKYIVISAYYDSHSVIPAISPGAQESCGVAFLLELARRFSLRVPRYSIIFLAVSGHNLGLTGARWFLNDWVRGKWEEFGRKIVLWINLDISSEATDLALLANGYLYSLYQFPARLLRRASQYISTIVQRVKASTGLTINIHEEGLSEYAYWQMLMPSTLIPLESEVASLAGCPSFSIVTCKTLRRFWQTPMDTVDHINMENLETQFKFVAEFIYELADTPNLQPKYLEPWSFGGMWSDLTGRICLYDEWTGWYVPVKNAIVCVRNYETGVIPRYLPSSGLYILSITDEEGRIFIPGLAQSASSNPWEIRAYLIDEETGTVTYAPDFGRYAYSGSRLNVEGEMFDFGYFTIFPCGSIILFDVGDPRMLNEPIDHSLFIKVNDHRTHSPPDHWGYDYEFLAGGDSIAVIYVPSGVPIEVMVHASYELEYPLCLLVNSSEESPLGKGLTANPGEQIILTTTILRYVEDFYRIRSSRQEVLLRYGMKIPPPSGEQHYLEIFFDARRRKDYVKAYEAAITLWSMEREFYVNIVRMKNDVINVTVFFSALLIPLSIIIERAFLTLTGIRRILSITVIFMICASLFNLLHPGFVLATDPLMLLLGLFTLILVTPLFSSILSNAMGTAKREHEDIEAGLLEELSKISFLFSLAAKELRRRRLRSSLLIISLILLTTSLILFSSFSISTTPRPIYVSGHGNYEGVLVKYINWGDLEVGISETLLSTLRSRFKGYILAPRAWLYTETDPSSLAFTLRYGRNEIQIRGVCGLTANDLKLFPELNSSIHGRWFEDYEADVCVITTQTASLLGISYNDLPVTITLEGKPIQVVGIIDAEVIKGIRDLDLSNHFLPLKIVPGRLTTHLEPQEVIWLPYRTVIKLGGKTVSVAIKCENSTHVKRVSLELYSLYDLEVYRCIGRETILLSRTAVLGVRNWQFFLIPFLLVSLSVINTLLTSIYERVREIMIMNCVGASPLAITLTFMAESLVYGLIGASMGYLVGVGITRVASQYLPAVNYSSTPSIMVLILTILSAIVPSIYPLWKSSKLITPSLERKWRVPTKATETEWTIPLPFVTPKEDIEGELSFLYEYFHSHRIERAPLFNVSNISYKSKLEAGKTVHEIVAEVFLAPYECGVKQRVHLRAVEEVEGKFKFELQLKRLTGDRATWEILSRPFIDDLRKRFILWSTLKVEDRLKYKRRGLDETHEPT